MADVAVITGGGGGMGLATARLLGRDQTVLLADVSAAKLDAAAAHLRGLGITADTAICDVTNRASVDALIARAEGLGTVVACVHTAGLSPQMASAARIVAVNAVGTVNVTTAFLDAATNGFRLVNVASMGAYMMPRAMWPVTVFRRAFRDVAGFESRLTRTCSLAPESFRPQLAYILSKQFVVWYSRRMAAAFGERGARIVSVSPGSIDTEMGRLEVTSGSAEMLRFAAIKRFGRVEEIAEVLAFCASPQASYLTGTDVVCDGGVTAGLRLSELRKMPR